MNLASFELPTNPRRRSVHLKPLPKPAQGADYSSAASETVKEQEAQMVAVLGLVDSAAETIKSLQQRCAHFESIARSLFDEVRGEMEEMKAELENCRENSRKNEARAVEAERRLAEAEKRAQDADAVAGERSRELSAFFEALAARLGPPLEALENRLEAPFDPETPRRLNRIG